MTLPASGAISSQQIDKTLFRQVNTPFSLNDPAARALAGIPSGPISFSSFYGKTNTLTSTFSNTGSYTYTVPNQVTSVSLVYPTAYGNVTTAYSVTPGQTIPVTIGGVGQISTFGSYTVPAIDIQIFSINTTTDNIDDYMFTAVASGQLAYYHATDVPATLSNGALAAGLDFYATQTLHGVQTATISMAPVSSATVAVTGVGTSQVYVSNFTNTASGFYTFVTSPTDPLMSPGETIMGYVTAPGAIYITPSAPPASMQNAEEQNAGSLTAYGPSYSPIGPYDITLRFYDPSSGQHNYVATVNFRNIVPITIVASA